MTDTHARIVRDLPNDEYQADPAIGSSGFKLLKRSRLHYWEARRNPERVERVATRALRRGSAFHCALFEPHDFPNRYIAIPEDLNRRTNEGKATWKAIEERGQVPMTVKEIAQVNAMANAARSMPFSTVLLEDHADLVENETSIFWTDPRTGARCKVRPDLLIRPCKMFPRGFILDGKSCEDASPAAWPRQAWNYDYPTQAAYYQDGFMVAFGTDAPPDFLWLAQESAAPYAGKYYAAGEDLLAYARKQYAPLLELFAESDRTDTWPGYPIEIETLASALPGWALKEIGDALA